MQAKTAIFWRIFKLKYTIVCFVLLLIVLLFSPAKARDDCFCDTPRINKIISDSFESLEPNKLIRKDFSTFKGKVISEGQGANAISEQLRTVAKENAVEPLSRDNREPDTLKVMYQAEPTKLPLFINDPTIKRNLFFSSYDFNLYSRSSTQGYELRNYKRNINDEHYFIYRSTFSLALKPLQEEFDFTGEKRYQFGVKWHKEAWVHTFLAGYAFQKNFNRLVSYDTLISQSQGIALTYEGWWNINEETILSVNSSFNQATNVKELSATYGYRYDLAENWNIILGLEGKLAKFKQNGGLRLGVSVSHIPFYFDIKMKINGGLDYNHKGKSGTYLGLALWQEY